MQSSHLRALQPQSFEKHRNQIQKLLSTKSSSSKRGQILTKIIVGFFKTIICSFPVVWTVNDLFDRIKANFVALISIDDQVMDFRLHYDRTLVIAGLNQSGKTLLVLKFLLYCEEMFNSINTNDEYFVLLKLQLSAREKIWTSFEVPNFPGVLSWMYHLYSKNYSVANYSMTNISFKSMSTSVLGVRRRILIAKLHCTI